ncbi:hypothetical protein PEC302107_08600 [Pectobacterium araliae]|uniref:Uncharacterized protein n=1 Tax=Pectobacterium araliae TaxID=3073862 RepID=A0AAN0MJ29_9GAMM|nr:hypothetical protein PEC302110_00170 [Pectobacterium sp. MAFF 302110]GKW19131.1 hypothetical protein PEC302107_08600 [Pectobacterium carotovorum subsp. carotovorum]
MELIIYMGEARSCSMEAQSAARKYDWGTAEERLNAASVSPSNPNGFDWCR